MSETPLLKNLIEAFRKLPGVGPKTAQRLAFHLLQRDRDAGKRLGHALLECMEKVGHCEQCRNFSEEPVCSICNSARRDESVLCVVENPSDLQVIEQSTGYQGKYFVLMGHLSPLDGIGPAEIGLDILSNHMKNKNIKEVIIATNPTVEGEATAHFISELAKQEGCSVSRLAHGIPFGGDLDSIDSSTLSHAFTGRTPV